MPVHFKLAEPPSEALARRVLTDLACTFAARIAAMLRHGASSGEAAAELERMVAPDRFRHVDRDRHERDWSQFFAVLAKGAGLVQVDYSVVRVKAAGNLVFLELEQRLTGGGEAARLLTMSVFEYDAAGRLLRLESFR